MKILIAEDDLASRKFLYKFLSDYGECDLTIDGMEAVEAFLLSIRSGTTYGLICLDIMMPKLDGIKVLKSIRNIEKQNNISPENASKVIMISALNESEIVHDTYDYGCQAYAVKPINIEKFLEVLKQFGIEKQQ